MANQGLKKCGFLSIFFLKKQLSTSIVLRSGFQTFYAATHFATLHINLTTPSENFQPGI